MAKSVSGTIGVIVAFVVFIEFASKFGFIFEFVTSSLHINKQGVKLGSCANHHITLQSTYTFALHKKYQSPIVANNKPCC